MALLQSVGSIVSLVLIAVGLYWLWTPGVMSTGQTLCILGLSSGLALNTGLWVFHLRDRIAVLEKQVREPE